MLIGFSVANFRSFAAEQSLSFIASSDRSHEDTHCVATPFAPLSRLTRLAVIFGPNGVGKSNLLGALGTMRDMVLHSATYSDSEFSAKYTPFNSPESLKAPTSFAIDVLLDATRYQYGFSHDGERITKEHLRVFKSAKSQRWFEREFDPDSRKESWSPFSANLAGPREMWRKATRPKALYLTTSGQLNAVVFRPLMHWFEHQLDIGVSSGEGDLDMLAMRLKDNAFKSRALAVLRASDIPVADLRVTNTYGAFPGTKGSLNAPGSLTNGPMIEFLRTHKGTDPLWLDSNHDSAGAKRLVALLMPLLDGMDRGRFVAIDEFDTSLHPLLSRFLIKTIAAPSAGANTMQALLVSHDTNLMDLELLRRDEVWLMECGESYESRLSSLLHYGPRRHELVARSYLRGRYGALPNVT